MTFWGFFFKSATQKSTPVVRMSGKLGNITSGFDLKSFKPIRLHHLKESVRLTQNCHAPRFPIVQPITCSNWKTCRRLSQFWLKEKKKIKLSVLLTYWNWTKQMGWSSTDTPLPEVASASSKVLPAWPWQKQSLWHYKCQSDMPKILQVSASCHVFVVLSCFRIQRFTKLPASNAILVNRLIFIKGGAVKVNGPLL